MSIKMDLLCFGCACVTWFAHWFMHHPPCRSAVPGGPHVLCVRGIRGHKEIRETPRWRKDGRHWWFPWRMMHIVSRAGDGGWGWGTWFGMLLGPVSYRTKLSEVISRAWPVCTVLFLRSRPEADCGAMTWSWLKCRLWHVPFPGRCFGVLLYDCTTSHSIWANFIYEMLYLSIQWLYWIWFKGCIMIFLNIIIIKMILCLLNLLLFKHFWLEVCGTMWIMPFCIPDSKLCLNNHLFCIKSWVEGPVFCGMEHLISHVLGHDDTRSVN